MARASSPPEAASTLAPAAIQSGAATLGLSITVDQAGRLARFAALLAHWNAVHNLTAIGRAEDVLTHHLLDSLAIVLPLQRIVGDRHASVLDVGSGGGLPGLPLAIVRPDWHVTLVDKVEKKVAFLTQARLELGLTNVECRHARVETLRAGPFDVVVARAFASLVDFVRGSGHLLAEGGHWAAMKGQVPADELAELQRAFPQVRVADIVKLDVPRLGAERHLILLQRP